MYRKIIYQDIKKNKILTLTLGLLIMTAALLVSLAITLSLELLGAIDHLMLTARSPHFLQMHSGPLDEERLRLFAETTPLVRQFQLSEFLNIEGADITANRQSLAESVEDYGLVMQNPDFDFLLNPEQQVIQPRPGEVYLPQVLIKTGFAKVGDTIRIGERALTVRGILRDSQMNSSLASSKRLLVHADDFQALRPKGNLEYLIEFRLNDLSRLSAFENAYAGSNLEANGPTVTYPLFRLINAFSDGIMIAVLLFISVVIVSISFLCIRFTLLSKIENEIREISILKAIGIRNYAIKQIYLAKYFAVALLGCSLGYGLSLPLAAPLLKPIWMTFGKAETSRFGILLPLAGVGFIFVMVLSFVSLVLRNIGKISVAAARQYAGTPQKKGLAAIRLSGRNHQNPASFLALQDILLRPKLYLSIALIWILSFFIMVLPMHLHTTISSPSFVNYMGIGQADLRVDIQQTDDISAKVTEIAEQMANDPRIQQYEVFTSKILDVKEKETVKKLKVEFGNFESFPIHYSSGKAPVLADEIALSFLQAEDWKKQVGDSIILIVNGKEKRMRISGIYSDITHGGKTAKATFHEGELPVLWAILIADAKENTPLQELATEYQNSFPYAKIGSFQHYIRQLYGTTLDSVKYAGQMAVAIGLMISGFITLLFLGLLIAKDRHSISVLKAIGFRGEEVQKQYLLRIFYVFVFSILAGIFLTNTLGTWIGGLWMGQMGIRDFHFVVSPLFTYLGYPLLLFSVIAASAYVGIRKINAVAIFDFIKE